MDHAVSHWSGTISRGVRPGFSLRSSFRTYHWACISEVVAWGAHSLGDAVVSAVQRRFSWVTEVRVVRSDRLVVVAGAGCKAAARTFAPFHPTCTTQQSERGNQLVTQSPINHGRCSCIFTWSISNLPALIHGGVGLW